MEKKKKVLERNKLLPDAQITELYVVSTSIPSGFGEERRKKEKSEKQTEKEIKELSTEKLKGTQKRK